MLAAGERRFYEHCRSSFWNNFLLAAPRARTARHNDDARTSREFGPVHRNDAGKKPGEGRAFCS